MSAEALWSMEIKDGDRWVAAGVCVLSGGRLAGGDNGHLYVGAYEIVKDHVEAEIRIDLYRGEPHAFWGTGAAHVRAKLTGERIGDEIHGSLERLDNRHVRLPVKLAHRADLV
jgi:hypothetical protein